MQTTRRRFLQSIAGSSTLISMGATVPLFLGRSALACREGNATAQSGENVLVVVQLSGGNDGLNTVIPYADDEYAKNRILLRIEPAAVRKIDDHVGLHPQMDGFSGLLEDGKLAVVQGVGYPNPNRSHFRSMDIWHAASTDEEARDGWLGRYLQQAPKGAEATAVESGLRALRFGQGPLPLALRARTTAVPSIESLQRFQLHVAGGPKQQQEMRRLIARLAQPQAPSEQRPGAADDASSLLPFLRRSALAAYTSSAQIQDALKREGGKDDYPGFALAQKLRMIAQLIDAQLPTRIYYVELGGFDTHANQAGSHAALLNELSESVTAFIRDLARRGHERRVLVMSFSEFGRRVHENASRGTDHGAAAPMFLAGGGLRPGVHGPHPSLADLDNGDLKHHTDFRRVYATVLQRWLCCSAGGVLAGDFEPLSDLIA